MDPASCRVVYVDDRFPAEKWLTRDTMSLSTTNNRITQALSPNQVASSLDLQANVNTILGVFNQVFVCNSEKSFSAKLAELQEAVKFDCTPILALFDVYFGSKHDYLLRPGRPKSKSLTPASPATPPASSPRHLTFSAEVDESYGLQLLSRIASDLQVNEGPKLVIPVAVVRPKQKNPTETTVTPSSSPPSNRNSPTASTLQGNPSPIDSHMMLRCLDAGALEVVASPLNNERTVGLTVHAYRIYKTAKKEQSALLASAASFVPAARVRKQSWVGVEDEKPYAYLREVMVKKLLEGICDPETFTGDYQYCDLQVEDDRKQEIIYEVAKWSFCAHDFSENELLFAGYHMLEHALKMPELENWRMKQDEILRFMQASRVAYNSFVSYHNFRHAVDVLQSLFFFLVQIGTIPPYPAGSAPPPFSQDKSPIAELLGPFEALTLLVSAIGHDVGHPGVNNMFLIKLNAPLAQLYNDQSVLESFHCAAYSQILRRHWSSAFADKSLRRLLISSILATDMGIHSGYMQQLGNLQEKIHESQTTLGWAPKDLDASRTLICGLLLKCADISNIARPVMIADQWSLSLQQEVAAQGEMESQVGMETAIYGGPPEIGNVMKLANGQIGFMSIFAYPLFANIADVIPAMGFATKELINNKSVCMARIEQEKRKQWLKDEETFTDGAVSPRSQNPTLEKSDRRHTSHSPSTEYFLLPSSPQRASEPPLPSQQSLNDSPSSPIESTSHSVTTENAARKQSETSTWKSPFVGDESMARSSITSTLQEVARTSSGVFPGAISQPEAQRPEVEMRKSSNTVPGSLRINGSSRTQDGSTTMTRASAEPSDNHNGRKSEPRETGYTTASVPLMCDKSILQLPDQQTIPEESADVERRMPVSKFSPTSFRQFSQTQSPIHNSGRMSFPSSAHRNSMATSGGQTYSTNLSMTLSPSTEATSFLSIESSDDQVDDHGNDLSDPTTNRNSNPDRTKSCSSVFSEVVRPHSTGHIPPALSNGEGRTTSPAKTTTAIVTEPGQETASAWEGDGERTMTRKISRLRFWRRKMEEDGR